MIKMIDSDDSDYHDLMMGYDYKGCNLISSNPFTFYPFPKCHPRVFLAGIQCTLMTMIACHFAFTTVDSQLASLLGMTIRIVTPRLPACLQAWRTG